MPSKFGSFFIRRSKTEQALGKEGGCGELFTTGEGRGRWMLYASLSAVIFEERRRVLSETVFSRRVGVGSSSSPESELEVQ